MSNDYGPDQPAVDRLLAHGILARYTEPADRRDDLAADRDRVVDALYPLFVEVVEDPNGRDAETEAERFADALLSSSVLLDAAEVRARALEDAADELAAECTQFASCDGWYVRWLRRRAAASEREGTT